MSSHIVELYCEHNAKYGIPVNIIIYTIVQYRWGDYTTKTRFIWRWTCQRFIVVMTGNLRHFLWIRMFLSLDPYWNYYVILTLLSVTYVFPLTLLSMSYNMTYMFPLTLLNMTYVSSLTLLSMSLLMSSKLPFSACVVDVIPCAWVVSCLSWELMKSQSCLAIACDRLFFSRLLSCSLPISPWSKPITMVI